VGDERHALIRLLKIPARLSRRGDPLNVIQRYRVSETIGVGAQRRATTEAMPLLSPFHDQAWDALASGWELDEFRERSQEAQDRRLAEERIRALWPAAQDGFQESIRNLEFKKLKASWACDPHDRQRAWRGWWLPLSATTAVDPLPSPVRHRIGI
jgi:DNA polymerase-3 subunit gamma/tau